MTDIFRCTCAAVFKSWRVWYMGLTWGLMTTGMNAIIFWYAGASVQPPLAVASSSAYCVDVKPQFVSS